MKLTSSTSSERIKFFAGLRKNSKSQRGSDGDLRQSGFDFFSFIFQSEKSDGNSVTRGLPYSVIPVCGKIGPDLKLVFRTFYQCFDPPFIILQILKFIFMYIILLLSSQQEEVLRKDPFHS